MEDAIDILIITKKKLDNSFPNSQFFIDGFKLPIRLDRTAEGGGIIIYPRENISSKLLENLPRAEIMKESFSN